MLAILALAAFVRPSKRSPRSLLATCSIHETNAVKNEVADPKLIQESIDMFRNHLIHAQKNLAIVFAAQPRTPLSELILTTDDTSRCSSTLADNSSDKNTG